MVYTATVDLCVATMKQLSDKSGVPYQKVYDVAARLVNKGFLEFVEGRPKKVKLVDPEVSFERFKQDILGIIEEIKEDVKRRSEGSRTRRSTHVEGRKQVIAFVKELVEQAKELRVVYPGIPSWLIGILRKFSGKLYLVVKDEDGGKLSGIRGEIKFRNEVKSKYLIIDESFSVIFTGEDYITVESCEGCMIHSTEHFQLLWSKLTTDGEEPLLLLKERKS
ncbi:TrmB family transcriptional regulator [Sulfodiicoccus acidiphilus]|uniref:TrmB family transcriptional regulator n=1 Tax=Sulfodiicoccus acidiphilus TaxID=1670455 RepID=A0A348B5Y3_9CREN|nr:TrmB family transcriptional regulator [Sulfodiicoccus acidiphilus]GGU01683.1 TrmB family transcriptional regulator [Sulfodiicoccus acidiphilus]